MSLVAYELDGGVATIALNNGKANPFSHQMIDDLNSALDQAEADDAVVILTSCSRIFSAGFDLGPIMESPQSRADLMAAGFTLSKRLLSHPYPVIVANPGHCMAMGAYMMMSADYAIAARGQFKIGFNETAIGITMPLAGQDIARARLTPAHFNLCLLLAEIQDPEGALHAGFLNQLVDADELMNEAKQRAETYSKFDMNVFKQSKLSMHAKLLEDIERNIRRDHEINLATPIVKPE